MQGRMVISVPLNLSIARHFLESGHCRMTVTDRSATIPKHSSSGESAKDDPRSLSGQQQPLPLNS
jgi:hypothetical protein